MLDSRKVNFMNKTRYIKALVLMTFLFSFIFVSHPCYADPIVETPFVDANTWVVILWIGCSILEAAIITFVLWRRHVIARALAASFILVFLLNIATMLTTAILANGIYGNAHNPNYWAELFPIAVETIFIWYLFHTLYKYSYMRYKMGVVYIILLVVVINLITFLIPFLVF